MVPSLWGEVQGVGFRCNPCMRFAHFFVTLHQSFVHWFLETIGSQEAVHSVHSSTAAEVQRRVLKLQLKQLVYLCPQLFHLRIKSLGLRAMHRNPGVLHRAYR